MKSHRHSSAAAALVTLAALTALTALMALMALMAGPAKAQAQQTCESISAHIETRMRGGGLNNFRLQTVDAAASASGRVVGTCGQGSRKIVYIAAADGTAASAPATPARPRTATRADDKPVLTECKDGTMAVGATCGR